MSYQIPLFQLNFGEEEIQAVTDTIRSKWISTGPKCEELENLFVNMSRFMALGVVEETTRRPIPEVDSFFTELEGIFASPEFTKAEVVESLKRFIPNFEHEEKGKNFYCKM